MNYRLVITTCGREGLLERTLESFETHVRPRPDEVVIVNDSGRRDVRARIEALCEAEQLRLQRPWRAIHHTYRQGFCETVADAWALAGDEGPPFVFWLEDDFIFRRALPLEDLAYTLEMQRHVAQMSLLRQPVSADEVKADGLLNIVPERFERRGSGTVAWIEHQAYWTTNPSLFRREIAADYPWPIDDRCEGMFAINLLDERPGTSFGIWGTGEQWVEHIGERAGIGY